MQFCFFNSDATIQFAEMDSTIEVDEGDQVQFVLSLATPGSGMLQTPITVPLTLIDGNKASTYKCLHVCMHSLSFHRGTYTYLKYFFS